MKKVANKRLAAQLSKVDMSKAFGVDMRRRTDINLFCPFHEDADSSKSKSLSASANGLWKCWGCRRDGDAFDYYAAVNGVTRDQAKKDLIGTSNGSAASGQEPARVLDESVVARSVEHLGHRQEFIEYLTKERGLNRSTIKRFQLGADEQRITIPIYNAEGQLVNLRRYLPKATKQVKMISFAKGFGAPELFPHSVLLEADPDDSIILCEGEWDCILLNQLGFQAVTHTGGVTTWESKWTEQFRGRHVVIIFDVNDKENDLGQKIAWERARTLRDVAASIKVVRLDLPESYVGGDITNYFVDEGRSPDDLRQLIASTPDFSIPGEVGSDDSEAIEVTLADASKSEYYYKRIRVRCIVAGKGSAPYLPPKLVRVETESEDGESQSYEKSFDAWDGAVLSLINCSTTQQKQFIRAMCGIAQGQPASIKVLETFNIEEVFLIPAVDYDQDNGPYVLRRCFYAGHGLQTNAVYDFEGYTLPDPRSQAATHVFIVATPSETDIDTFALDDDDVAEMRDLFSGTNVADALTGRANDLAKHVTKIYGRPDLHMAVDLVYHSALAFEFDGVVVRKGWLELLVMGDTRTGKGFVTEGLCRHYGLGDVLSGENISLAGLVGSVQKVGERWTLVWGKLPLSDRRLVVMDECGSLSHEDIGRLSRIRSEGIAEITKVISEKTSARVRLIWLANPRPQGEGVKRLIMDYNYGIEAVPELIGAAEDVARFDLALIVAHNEVPHDIINATHHTRGRLKFTSEACRKLIMWVWSRRPEDIVYPPPVVDFTMRAARELGRYFSPKMSLVQGEDVRFKLAKLAVAAAGMMFSSPDGKQLIVKREHVEFAYNFLHQIYSKGSCGYAQFSASDREKSVLRDPKAVEESLAIAGDLLPDLIDGLLEHRQITARDLCDYAGIDVYCARSILSELVRHRAIVKEYTWYIKKPAFREFLRSMKAKLSPDHHHTMPDDEET